MIDVMVVVVVMMIGKIFVPSVMQMLLRLRATTADDAHPAIGAQNSSWTFLAIGGTSFTDVIVA